MNIVGAVVAGIIGTLIISMVMAMGPKMGMPKMDIVGMLGSMFNPNGNTPLGWVIHLMMGVVFAIIYAALWSFGFGSATVVGGLLFGVVHWFVVGTMMGAMPMMHAGIKAGQTSAPGILMLNNGGLMGFMGGLIGHAIYGIVVALIYAAFI